MNNIIDTVVLRVMAFAHPEGLNILLEALNASSARLPSEVYNLDEDDCSLKGKDLSELAKGLRYAKREGRRVWLSNAEQLSQHFQQGTLIIETLSLEEIEERVNIELQYKIGTGESACLVLARRYQALAVFLSSDKKACKIAEGIGISYLTLQDIIEIWVEQKQPTLEELNFLVNGMENANFRLPGNFLEQLRQRCQP
ncbi:MAG: hypothetical protein SWX82_02045 [Cyanobacteriota bacterium]|nr:hypothetical protein [Cyanobacteriota bacterium]